MDHILQKLASASISLTCDIDDVSAGLISYQLSCLLRTAFLFYFAAAYDSQCSILLGEELLRSYQRLRQVLGAALAKLYYNDELAAEELSKMLDQIKLALLKLVENVSTVDKSRIILGQLYLDINKYINSMPTTPYGFYQSRIDQVVVLLSDNVKELSGVTDSRLVLIKNRTSALINSIAEATITLSLLRSVEEIQVKQDAVITDIYLAVAESADGLDDLMQMYNRVLAL